MSQNNSPSVTLTRTIYDPATKDFVTSTPDSKALPHIREWINQHNPVIYWYILRIDNQTDTDISQWAVELYAHQALTITEAYIDGSDRRFELRKERHDPWTEKCVLSIPRQIGIPIVGKGTRRIFFKVDIDCKEGLMHEYGISGAFMAKGTAPVEIKEKMFQYSCKVGEFKQIFDKDPHEASHYAEKRLMGKYSTNSVQVFTNSFRMIHELYGYCHSGSLDRDELLQKLHLLHASFEKVPEIAGERISPLISDGIRELDVIVDKDKFAPRLIKLCDALVELLHIEVMGAEMKGGTGYIPPTIQDSNVDRTDPGIVNGQNMCPSCGNIIDSSNKSLICRECGKGFCTTCEEWFRVERKSGQKPLCENCYSTEQECKKPEEKKAGQRIESSQRLEVERELKEREEKEQQEAAKREHKLKKEENKENIVVEAALTGGSNPATGTYQGQDRFRREGKKEEKPASSHKKFYAIALVLGTLLVGFWLQDPVSNNNFETDDIELITTETPSPFFVSSTSDKTNSIGMDFVFIPAGEFKMGSPWDEEGRFSDEGPIHAVTIEKAYYLGKYEVTQEQWREVMGSNPSYYKGDELPVEQVSWYDVQDFIWRLNQMEGTYKYRLPSEAEWEYAARAGTNTRYYFGDDESDLSDYAWWDVNSDFQTHPVGLKQPNPWGLYDMHGNVLEWVQDRWYSDYYGAPTDGSAWEGGSSSFRVYRGGGWYDFAGECRSASRFYDDPTSRSDSIGFRLLLEL